MIEKIITLKKPETLTVDDKTYIQDGYNPLLDRFPGSLDINNLTGIVDYINASPEKWDGELFIHVADFDHVFLYQGMIGDFNQRVTILSADSRPCKFMFGRKIRVEDFIIALHGMFLPNEDRDYLLTLVSSVKIDASATLTDDGASQTVTAKQGVSSLVTPTVIKNPLLLQPFRTFNEVEQPASQFIFRFGKDGDSPVCSLHECDGEAWKQEAIQRIKAFFIEELPDVPVIA
ncbi:MAG: hypothetical protein JEZ12_16140 [Desulfobacterium sp.]|nr:hypothetical protein [Desulfobacterium sp.]